jgi:hypothetical protein
MRCQMTKVPPSVCKNVPIQFRCKCNFIVLSGMDYKYLVGMTIEMMN